MNFCQSLTRKSSFYVLQTRSSPNLTWQQLRLHKKPIVLLDVGGFWDGLLGLVEALVQDGFVPAASRECMVLAASPAELVRLLAG